MPKHYCIDPHDSYAQREVLVEFAGCPYDVHLIAAIDESGADILPDHVEEQCRDLQREIAAFFRFPEPSPHPHRRAGKCVVTRLTSSGPYALPVNKSGEASVIEHGTRQFPGLRLDSYNLTLRENGGFIGDWARSRTFALILGSGLDQHQKAMTAARARAEA